MGDETTRGSLIFGGAYHTRYRVVIVKLFIFSCNVM